MNERRFSLLNHVMVPRHEILSENEAKAVLTNYNVEKEHLPKIRATDPVALEIKAKVGNIIKITRKSQTAGEAVFYRLVM